MTKRIISILTIAAMICMVFAGCSPDDVALYKAIQKVPESCVVTQTASFDVTVIEPVSVTNTYTFYDGETFTYTNEMTGMNYLLRLLSELLSITKIESTTTKAGNLMESKLTYTLPDAAFSFNAWAQTDDNGQAQTAVISMPSYVRPFLPASLGQKQYISFDMSKYFEFMAEMNAAAGTEAGTTILPDAQSTMSAITMFFNDEAVIDQLAAMMDINFVSSVERSGNNTVYTVKLDGPALKSIIKGVVSSMYSDEAAAIAALVAGVSADEYRKDMEGADEYADKLSDFIINTGMFENGITTKYTVSGDGYVVRTEQDIDLNIDLPRIVDAAAKLTAAIEGEDPEELYIPQVTGKFKVAANIVSNVTKINSQLDVRMPQLTDANCIDIIGDIEEYYEYQMAYYEWWESWYDDQPEIAYADMHVPGEPLTLRNNETGVEIVTIPKTQSELDPEYDVYNFYYNDIYVPITDLAKLFDDVLGITWNNELKGVEVRYMYYGEECVDLILNPNGREMYFTSEDSTPYEAYDYVLSYMEDYQFADDGKLYVDIYYFNDDMAYSSRFEGDKYCYTSDENIELEYKEMDDNFFYALENMFY